jgi:hypothetical protein
MSIAMQIVPLAKKPVASVALRRGICSPSFPGLGHNCIRYPCNLLPDHFPAARNGGRPMAPTSPRVKVSLAM